MAWKGSPPSRGAWIEILCFKHLHHIIVSPPSRGAWIEIQKGGAGDRRKGVAPLAGGVD